MASGMREVDPHPDWRKLNRQARGLFNPLGELRDTQVLLEWTQKLMPENDPVGISLMALLLEREEAIKQKLQPVLIGFSEEDWRSLSQSLPARLEGLKPDGPVFEIVALQRLGEARSLHKQALRNRTHNSFHRLRVGIKHLRYTVENFLPERHALWKTGFKQIQDCLGEMHDLFVLWRTMPQVGPILDKPSRLKWRSIIDSQIATRLDFYRSLTMGPDSLWWVWRSGLPTGDAMHKASVEKVEMWARLKDPDFARARNVRDLSLGLFEGLTGSPGGPSFKNPLTRYYLEIAAMMHQIGRSQNKRPWHKESAAMIKAMPPLPGWTERDMDMVAQIVRHQRGMMPSENGFQFKSLPAESRRLLMFLTGVLRLARLLGTDPQFATENLKIESSQHAIHITAAGWSLAEAKGHTLARDRYLIETVCKKPIVFRF